MFGEIRFFVRGKRFFYRLFLFVLFSNEIKRGCPGRKKKTVMAMTSPQGSYRAFSPLVPCNDALERVFYSAPFYFI